MYSTRRFAVKFFIESIEAKVDATVKMTSVLFGKVFASMMCLAISVCRTDDLNSIQLMIYYKTKFMVIRIFDI